MNDIEHQINMIRHTRIITDPFPEHSAYLATLQMLSENRSPLKKLFRIEIDDSKFLPQPPDISIWAAYQRGYDQAYKEIKEGLIDTVLKAGAKDE